MRNIVELRALLSNPDISVVEKLEILINSLTKQSGKEDMVTLLRNRLLMYTAKQYGYHYMFISLVVDPLSLDSYRCTHIFFGDNATFLAIRILALTSKGRGYSLPLETAV